MGATPSATSLSSTPGTLGDQVFLRLREAIVSGALVPGERILEPALAARFGVSRGPLRDALARLAERHLIERPVHQGAR
ncbi:MAG: GntR family transcriptional regulator, partial [Proteobacteria bacterium]|nr:GntR family transcriptional regulator [Pseudomonadota bacterium]